MSARRRLLQGALATGLTGVAGRAALADSNLSSPTLGAMRAVTITAGDLNAVEQAWTRDMGYRVLRRGKVSAATARSWNAPAVAGKGVLVLGPDSGEPTVLRFVEQAMPPGYSAAGAVGWTTTEITVQNSDQLYERLKDSPFKITGPPSDVPTYSYLHAMQAEGPAGERLNLTWIREPRPDLAVAKSFVGRCFIVVQNSPDLPKSLKFYQDVFGNSASPIRDLTTIKLSVVKLDDGAKIEIDQLGPGGKPPLGPPGGMPQGIALVTFDCSAFDRQRPRFLAAPIKADLGPRLGRATATLMGPSGELIELVAQ